MTRRSLKAEIRRRIGVGPVGCAAICIGLYYGAWFAVGVAAQLVRTFWL